MGVGPASRGAAQACQRLAREANQGAAALLILRRSTSQAGSSALSFAIFATVPLAEDVSSAKA